MHKKDKRQDHDNYTVYLMIEQEGLMHSDQTTKYSISESMIQALY